MKKFYFALLLIVAGMISIVRAGDNNTIFYAEVPPDGHIQGMAGNDKFIYRVFSHHIIKSDMKGKTVKMVECHERGDSFFHAGGPCLVGDKLYVPVCRSSFNRDLNGKPSLNYIQVYDLDLNYIKSFHIPELQHGAGCITWADGHFFVSGGRRYQLPGNSIYEYDSNFKFIRRHDLNITTYVGVQTMAYDGKDFWLGCFGSIPKTFKVSRDFKNISYYTFACGVGMIIYGRNKMLINMPLGDNRAKYIDPEKHLLPKKYIDIDQNGIARFEGTEYVDLSALVRSSYKKHPGVLFVLRCSKKIPFSTWVAVRQYIPQRCVIKIVD